MGLRPQPQAKSFLHEGPQPGPSQPVHMRLDRDIVHKDHDILTQDLGLEAQEGKIYGPQFQEIDIEGPLLWRPTALSHMRIQMSPQPNKLASVVMTSR